MNVPIGELQVGNMMSHYKHCWKNLKKIKMC